MDEFDLLDCEHDLQIDVDLTCRCCLYTSSVENMNNELKKLFSTDLICSRLLALPKIYSKTLNMVMPTRTDHLPSKVCQSCLIKIREFYLFKEKCMQTNVVLHQILRIPLQKEPGIMPSVPVKSTSTVETQTEVIDIRTTETQTERSCKYVVTQTIEVCRQSSHCQTEDVPTKTIAVNTDIDAQLLDELTKIKQNTPQVMLNPEMVSSNNSRIEEWADQASSSTSLEEIEIITVDQISTAKREPDTYGADYEEFYEEEYLTVVENESGLEELEVEDKKLVISKYELIEDENLPESDYIEPHNTPPIIKQRFADMQKDSERIELTIGETSTMIAPKIAATVETHFCPLCQIKVKGTAKIQQHKDVHSKTFKEILNTQEYYKCGSCRSVFMTIESLEEHVLSNCQPINYSTYPSAYYQNFYDLNTNDGEEDIFASITLENGLYNCIHCVEYSDKSLHALVKHNVNDHVTIPMVKQRPEPHTCGICLQILPTATATRSHIYFHSDTFDCPFAGCENKYNKFFLLTHHLLTKHVAPNERKCPHCGLQIGEDAGDEETRNRLYNQHVLQLCEKRKHKCSYCDKKFLKRSCLNMHERIHTSEKRFECDVCNKKFIQCGDMKAHMRIHTNSRPYKCEICEKTFRISSHKTDHMNTHNSVNTHECAVCGKKFKSKRILAEHVKIHENSKKYKCDTCFKTFLRNTHLTSHKKVHKRRHGGVNVGPKEGEQQMRDQIATKI